MLSIRRITFLDSISLSSYPISWALFYFHLFDARAKQTLMIVLALHKA